MIANVAALNFGSGVPDTPASLPDRYAACARRPFRCWRPSKMPTTSTTPGGSRNYRHFLKIVWRPRVSVLDPCGLP
jgi:hypothetical protein